MNTKKLFMLLAALLLGSVSAMAQSGNNSPLVGDVNGDSKVDVADITAVIKIIKNTQEHYFYLGTIEPTAENYKIIPGATTSYTSFDETVGTTVSVDAGQMLYMLCPAEWVKGKTVTLEDNSGETLNFSEDIDYTTISGYAIYKTQVLNDAKDVTLKGSAQPTTYYWYVGQSNPAEMTTISPIVTDTTSPGWRLTGNSLTATYNYDSSANPITGASKAEWYFALPENSGLGVFDAQNTNYAIGNPISTVTFNTVKYNIWKTGSTRSFNAYYIKNK